MIKGNLYVKNRFFVVGSPTLQRKIYKEDVKLENMLEICD